MEFNPGSHIDPKATELALSVQRRIEESRIANSVRTTQSLIGKRPTVREVARSNGITIAKAGNILSRHKVLVRPLPVVRKDSLPDNEEAFFRGFQFGNYAFQDINWSRHRFIAITTDSQDPRKHQLLRVTAGSWGEIREFDLSINGKKRERTRVYLDYDTFPFMAEEKFVVGSRILLSHERFPTFLLGLNTVRLTDAQSRISLRDVNLLRKINKRFTNQFGFPLGRFSIETRKGEVGKMVKLGVINVREPGEVFAALVQVESVCKLPFFRALAMIK